MRPVSLSTRHGIDRCRCSGASWSTGGGNRLDVKERKRIDREVRRLNAEFGMRTGRQDMVALMIAGLLIFVVVGGLTVLIWPFGVGEPAVGRVDGLRLSETSDGTRLKARVTVGAVQALVPIPTGTMCLAGDRIDLVKRKTRFRVNYTFGIGGCTRPNQR